MQSKTSVPVNAVIASDPTSNTIFETCIWDQRYAYILFAWLAVLLVCGLVLSYQLRNVVCVLNCCSLLTVLQPTSFNESRRIGYTVYSTTFCAIVLIPVCITLLCFDSLIVVLWLDYGLEGNPNSLLAIRAFGLFFVSSMIMLPLCVPVISSLMSELRNPELFRNGLPSKQAICGVC